MVKKTLMYLFKVSLFQYIFQKLNKKMSKFKKIVLFIKFKKIRFLKKYDFDKMNKNMKLNFFKITIFLKNSFFSKDTCLK